MKSYNWKKGILFFIVCGLIGAVLGACLNIMGTKIQAYAILSAVKIFMPYLFVVAFISGVIGLIGYFYFKMKLKIENYSDEDGSFYERHENLMGIVLMLSTLAAVINFTALGVNLFNGTPLVWLFLVNVILAFFGEVGHISLMKKIRPELNADPLNANFSRNYFDQLDEYEKNKVGKASVNTLTAMVPVYVGLFVVCYILTLFLELSPVICLPIGIIWGVQTILLTYYSNKKK